MLVIELFENDTIEQLPTGYHSEQDDNSTLSLKDMRKTRLTLGQLQKLRILNDVRQLEFEQKVKKVAKQYSPPAEPGGMGM